MSALSGLKVVDLSALAPGPFASMMLADFGANVIVVEPVTSVIDPEDHDALRSARRFALGRNKRSICIDLKRPEGRDLLLRLADDADVVLEGFRPGVMSRLGLGWEALHPRNPRLVYCSLSGYGQDGPYAQRAGHDLNYAAVAGVLGTTGRPGSAPAIPMNFLADYAGGGLMAAYAIVVALLSREKTGAGQYVDVAMSDGALALATKLVGLLETTGDVPRPGAHRINGGMPYYDVHRCRDGRYLAVGPLEPRFWANLCAAVGLPELAGCQHDEARRDEVRAALEARFAQRTRDEWFAALGGADACVTPVYDLDEALDDPQNLHRGMVPHVGEGPDRHRMVGIAPKLGSTPGAIVRLPPLPGEHTDEVLRELGADVAALRRAGVVA